MADLKINFSNSRVVSDGALTAIAGLSVADGFIQRIFITAPSEVNIDFDGVTLMPGFVDIHNHGGFGVDVNAASADDLLRLADGLARHGVAAWLPTLVPDTDENYRRAIEQIDLLMKRQASEPVAQAVGVHYEGVFAAEKMCGALRPEYFKSYKPGVVKTLPRLKAGVHVTTLAPEIEGGIDLIREFASEGWVVSIGHTRADPRTLDAAFDAGARHATHFFNAMTGIHHRDLGVAGWCLTKGGMTFDIIADGIHVDPKMLEMAMRSHGPASVSLISDSIAPAGLGDGEYELWGQTIAVKDGRTQNAKGGIAGSVITLADAVRRLLGLGFSAEDVAAMSSSNPMKLLGLESAWGSIEPGSQANLVGIDRHGQVAFSVINGQLISK